MKQLVWMEGKSRSFTAAGRAGVQGRPLPLGQEGPFGGERFAGWGGTALSLQRAGYVEQMELSYSY